MSDERDNSSGGAQADGASTAGKRAGKVSVLRLRKALQPKIAVALHALADKGPFSQVQSVDAMRAVLKDVDLNDYKGEFAQRIAAIEVHVRHSQFGKAIRFLDQGQFDMFTEELAEDVWLPTGDGMHVSLAHATWAHILNKEAEQRANVEDAISNLEMTVNALVTPYREQMEPYPRREFREVMYAMGRWQRKEVAA